MIENTRSKFNSANAKLIHDVILKGIRNGEFRSFNKSTIDIICYSIISFMTTLAMDFSLENKRFNVKRRIDIFIEILFNGLRN